MDDARWDLFALVARFDDAVNRRDVTEFATLWTEDAVWEIGEPKPLHLVSRDQIVATWQKMVEATTWLFRGSFAGVVEIDGDTARGRWPCIETGVFLDGEGYDNRSLYVDRYIRTASGWRIQKRSYEYMWLSNAAIPGKSFPLPR